MRAVNEIKRELQRAHEYCSNAALASRRQHWEPRIQELDSELRAAQQWIKDRDAVDAKRARG